MHYIYFVKNSDQDIIHLDDCILWYSYISHSGQALREHLERREQWPERPENACFSEDPGFEVDSEE